jgi:hypothetical protein
MAGEDYKLPQSQRSEYGAVFLLHYSVAMDEYFPYSLGPAQEEMRPFLRFLQDRGCVEVIKDCYTPTERGRARLDAFFTKYLEFLIVFDLYSAVDLESGEFAFESYSLFDDETAWQGFLSDSRWEDLRVGVTDYKDMNPLHAVYMSFINLGRFMAGQSKSFANTVDDACTEILAICNSALHEEDLGYDSPDGRVRGEQVMDDILERGTEILFMFLEDNGAAYVQNAEFASPLVSLAASPNPLPEPDWDQLQKYRDPDYVSPAWRESTLL